MVVSRGKCGGDPATHNNDFASFHSCSPLLFFFRIILSANHGYCLCLQSLYPSSALITRATSPHTLRSHLRTGRIFFFFQSTLISKISTCYLDPSHSVWTPLPVLHIIPILRKRRLFDLTSALSHPVAVPLRGWSTW